MSRTARMLLNIASTDVARAEGFGSVAKILCGGRSTMSTAGRVAGSMILRRDSVSATARKRGGDEHRRLISQLRSGLAAMLRLGVEVEGCETGTESDQHVRG